MATSTPVVDSLTSSNLEVNKAPSSLSLVEDEKVDRDPTTNRLAHAQNMTQEEYLAAEKSLRRKLDFRLLGMLWLIFILNYLDRKNIAAAKVAGMQKDLGLSSTQYATAIALLFVGYILMQVPSNVYLTQVRPSLYLPSVMMVWGVVSALTGVCQNAGGLYATRFILGAVEAAYYPGALFLLSSWYRRSELGFRGALLFSGSQIGSAFSGLIGAGIQHGMDGAGGLESWRWIFILEGAITVFVAICAYFVLPDYPSNTKWLTPTERAVAEWRLIQDAGQVDEDDESWSYGFKLCFKDWRVYIFAIMLLCVQVSSATSNFFPSVVETLGFSKVNTLLLTVPPYMVTLMVSVANNYSADRLGNSSFHIVWPMCMAITGYIVAVSTTAIGPRYFSMIIMLAGAYGSNAVLVAWTQKTMLRPRIKRASAVAFVNAFGNVAQVFSSYLYPDESAPRYVLAMATNSGFALVAISLALFMRMVLRRANKRLAEGDAQIGEVMVGQATQEIQGITDEERRARKEGFRYIT